MRIGFIRAMMLMGLAAFSGTAFSHGLVQDPPARNWYCGVVTKPDHVTNGVAAGQLGAATGRTFAAQFGGSGSVHPVAGDTWRVAYSIGGVAQTPLTGTFP